jgi:AraC-like DNA-binding protein
MQPENRKQTPVIKLSACFTVISPKYHELKLYVKYMVSIRCKMVVKAELDQMGVAYVAVDLGTIELFDDISREQRQQLKLNLLKSGLELMDDKKSVLIEKVKNLIEEMIHDADELPEINYSEYISKKMQHEYNSLAAMFSEVKGITIQQYIIYHKIEKVKELLLYNNISLTDIAYKLHYSSVAHLSSQFKKITGLSPSFFKEMKQKRNGILPHQ